MTRRALIGLFVHRLADPMRELTGIGRYAVHLTDELVRRDRHDYVLLAPFEGASASGDWPDVPVVRVGGGRRVLQLRWAVTGRPRLDDLLPDLDLVHSLLPVAAVRTRTPLVTTIHDLFLLDRPAWWGAPQAQATFALSVRHLARTARAVIVPSGAVAADARRHLGIGDDRLTVIHEGVDDRFREVEPTAAPTVADLGLSWGGYDLALGNVSARKNLDVLVRAVASLAEIERVPLVLAGNRQETAGDLVRLADTLGVGHLVHLTGFVSDEELPALVAGARALLHPSVHEGFGLPVAEAMAGGVPVVAARAGSLPEVVGGGGILVEPRDVAGWAEAIGRLADPGIRERWAARAETRGQHFRWEQAAERTEAVYNACL